VDPTRCPPGYYCSGGVPTACAPGRYNGVEGATSVAACLECAADTYNPSPAAASVAFCLPCVHGGSMQGSVACWPGVTCTSRNRHGRQLRIHRRAASAMLLCFCGVCNFAFVCLSVLSLLPQPFAHLMQSRLSRDCQEAMR
jgi:hypothetical protein